ncbi:MAG: hypothetical protein Q7K42_01525 [Candidatus Diapherotrites archaeon]|nr:hypothetical protein [Candidatus Diapherotrites archaeon]
MNLRTTTTVQHSSMSAFDERDVKLTIKEVMERNKVGYIPYSLSELDPYTLSTLGLKGSDLKIVWDNVKLLQQRKNV